MGIIDFLFPVTCLECGKEGKYLCKSCVSKIIKAKQFCLECHKPSIDGATHSKCKRKMSIDFTYSLWDYSGVVRKAIVNLKYRFAYRIADEIAEYFIDNIKETFFLPKSAVLIPIPLHKSRYKWRGFNQAELLGEAIAKKMNWYFDPILTRSKKTQPQTTLRGKERASNLTGAFSALSFIDRGLPYILFDDVLTTGSTIKEACRTLKRKGLKNVLGLTIAS